VVMKAARSGAPLAIELGIANEGLSVRLVAVLSPSVPMRMMQFTPGSLHSMARKDYPDDAHAPQADRRIRR
jgi:hypothetical protein